MQESQRVILIVEDDREMAQYNARLLKRKGYRALTAYTAADARAMLDAVKPSLLVLDVGLPDGSGLALCEEFRKSSDAPVVFLTGRSESSDKVAGLSTGGDYYLTKPFDKEEFLAVVQSLLRRARRTQERIGEASLIKDGSLTLKVDERKAYIDGRDAGLTLKEFAVLQYMIQNRNTELSSESIYTAVWGTAMNNDANAVRLTISRLKKKLDEENALDFAILTKYGGGYTFVEL